MPKQPKLRAFAGSNGSGKTTLFDSIKSEYFSTKLFVNADFLEEAFKKYGFINYSDFSHPSKLDLIGFAHLNNYKVYLYFIGTETPIMNLERVKERVKKGGHPVDGIKIQFVIF